jgi:CheY-like chemotaxis protein
MNSGKAKILVVDDDAHLLELLVDTLSAIGYQVIGVPGGMEALERLKTESFDLLVTDIKMPVMDGIALSKKVRRYYPGLPVLFITGVASPEIIGRASPDGFLAKPFRINHIEELIESTLKDRPETLSTSIKRVMVVDDDQTFREMLADALQYDEYIPLAVGSGEDALRELERGEVDAVIADIKMPGMDGISLLKQIKERYSDIPVILITAYLSDEEIKQHAVDDIADGFIKKPFRVEKIVDLLNQISPTSPDKLS